MPHRPLRGIDCRDRINADHRNYSRFGPTPCRQTVRSMEKANGGRGRTVMGCLENTPRRRARSRYTYPGLKAKARHAASMPTLEARSLTASITRPRSAGRAPRTVFWASMINSARSSLRRNRATSRFQASPAATASRRPDSEARRAASALPILRRPSSSRCAVDTRAASIAPFTRRFGANEGLAILSVEPPDAVPEKVEGLFGQTRNPG